SRRIRCGRPTVPAPASLVSFFFQAEDGIRDFHVTGVQTCALPISRCAVVEQLAYIQSMPFSATSGIRDWVSSSTVSLNASEGERSEERRVGKECRSRWAACQYRIT